MVLTIVSGSAIVYKAGAGVNTNLSDQSAIVVQFGEEAEAEVCMLTRKDWKTDYASVKTTYKKAIGDVISDRATMKCINYDMSGYTSRLEAQTMLDVLRDHFNNKIEALKDDKVKEVM